MHKLFQHWHAKTHHPFVYETFMNSTENKSQVTHSQS